MGKDEDIVYNTTSTNRKDKHIFDPKAHVVCEIEYIRGYI